MLILGGGEGATLREVLRHPEVTRCTMVDIDGDVVELSKKYLPEWSAGAFDDPRANVIIGDALAFIKQPGTFDAIVSDLTEPLPDSPSFPLFNGEVFRDIKARLAPGGVYVLQASTAGFHNMALHAKMARSLRAHFAHVASFFTHVPAFDNDWAFIACSDGQDVAALAPERIDAYVSAVARRELFLRCRNASPPVQPAALPAPRARQSRRRLRLRLIVDDEPLRRTALFDVHRALGARIVPFGGFEMPVQYAGILAEHDAVRQRAGLFDLSHMAQFELRGADVAAWADALTVNHVATMKPLQARYNIFTNDAGGAHDDVIFYRLRRSLAAGRERRQRRKMWDYLQSARSGDVTLTDLRGETRADRGARSAQRRSAAPLVEADIATLKYYTCVETNVGGSAAVVARTGYTGEDGFELFVTADAAPACGMRCSRSTTTVWRRAAWARATCCASKPACRSTVTS